MERFNFGVGNVEVTSSILVSSLYEKACSYRGKKHPTNFSRMLFLRLSQFCPKTLIFGKGST